MILVQPRISYENERDREKRFVCQHKLASEKVERHCAAVQAAPPRSTPLPEDVKPEMDSPKVDESLRSKLAQAIGSLTVPAGMHEARYLGSSSQAS
jgi:hypothetical protein